MDDYSRGRIQSRVLRDSDSLLLRLFIEKDKSVILKLWNRRGIRSVIRSFTNSDPASRECNTLQALSNLGIATPKLLGRMKIRYDKIPYNYCVFTEDLGSTTTATKVLNKYISNKNEVAINDLEYKIISLTEILFSNGIVDPDNILANMLIDHNGKFWRIDFELAQKAKFSNSLVGLRGKMIGRLIASYTWAVQPELWRVQQFSSKLANTLILSENVKTKALKVFNEHVNKQYDEIGIDSRTSLPW